MHAGISTFEGWIVNIDSVCQATDLPGNAAAVVAAAGRPKAEVEVRARLPNQLNEHMPKAVAQQACKRRSKFQLPRAALVLPYGAPMTVAKSQTESAHNPSGLKGCNTPSTSAACTKPESQQPLQQCLIQKRSGLCHIHLGVLAQETMPSSSL